MKKNQPQKKINGFHIITAGFILLLGWYALGQATKRTLYITDMQHNIKDVSALTQYTKLYPEQEDTVLELVNKEPLTFTQEDIAYITDQVQLKFPQLGFTRKDVSRFKYRWTRYAFGQLTDYYAARFEGMDKNIAVFLAKEPFYNEDPSVQQRVIVLKDIY